jgi:hypothetical protein
MKQAAPAATTSAMPKATPMAPPSWRRKLMTLIACGISARDRPRMEAPRGSRAGAVQINDVFVDERGVIYAVDRLAGGLYVLELDL